jgi:hypothetical protein
VIGIHQSINKQWLGKTFLSFESNPVLTFPRLVLRIHRDGQKRQCVSSRDSRQPSLKLIPSETVQVIYRFLTTGTLDEKIYQRQITKIGLSTSLMDNGKNANTEAAKANAFTRSEVNFSDSRRLQFIDTNLRYDASIVANRLPTPYWNRLSNSRITRMSMSFGRLRSDCSASRARCTGCCT